MGYVQEARENHVKKKVEEALRSKMKQKALKECDQLTAKYAECASGRTFSVVWKCRKQAKELNGCLHQYTNDSVLEEMKKEYVLKQGIVILSFGITNYVSAGWLLLLWELVAARKLKDHNLRKKLETR